MSSVLEQFQINDVTTLIGIASFAGGLVAAHFKGKLAEQKMISEIVSDRDKKLSEIVIERDRKIAELEKKLSTEIAQINVKVELFWRMVADNVPKLLMEPTHQTRDELLALWTADQEGKRRMTAEEMQELISELYQLIDQVKETEENRYSRTSEMYSKATLAMMFLPVVQTRLHELMKKDHTSSGDAGSRFNDSNNNNINNKNSDAEKDIIGKKHHHKKGIIW